MNKQSGWSNIHASTNMMKFTHETNKLQRDGSSYSDHNNYNKSDNNTNTSTYQKIYPENPILSATASNYDNEKARRGFHSQHTKNRSVMDAETLQLLQQMAEIKKFSEQNQLPRSNLYSTIEVIKQFIGTQLPSKSNAIYLIHKNIAENSRNIGLRGRLCYNCCSHWIDPVHNNKEEGMKSLLLQKLPRHECDPKKVLEISKYNSQDLTSRKIKTYEGLSDFLTLVASSLILFGQKPIHLNIEELDSTPPPQKQTSSLNHPAFRESFTESQNQSLGNNKGIGEKAEQDNRQSSSWIMEENCVNLGNINKIRKNHWAYRAIKEEKIGDKKSITIDDIELVDFFRIARASFGAFRVQMEDNLPHYFFIYFILN